MKLDLSLLEERGYERDAKRECAGIASQLKLQRFPIPNVLNVDDFQTAAMERFKPSHGTTTLAFVFQEGILVAVDSRSTMGSYIGSQTVMKAIEINDFLLGTMAGVAGDCQFWGRYLGMKARLYELDHGKRITVRAASKMLADIAFQYRGSGLGMGMMVAGWDAKGPALFYVDSEAQRTQGNVFSVGSGSLYAYGVMDSGYRWDLTKDEAIELGRRSIYHATFRDTMSGGTVSVYHITKEGWTKVSGTDVDDLYDAYTAEKPDVPFE